MVTVVKTPEGHKIIDQAVTATITEDYVGDAVVTLTGHSLSTGSTVYITSDLDEYNGFWYVTVITADTFKISEHSAADFVEYYQDADIEYYQTQPHVWSSIFLPIVYKATNDLWPTNSVDTARTVSSFADDNGFTEVILSGALRSLVNMLEFVKISGTDEHDGIWQIVEVISTSNVVLNLPYADDLDFTGATIQYYYNNYQVKVKIYSGLPAGHSWSSKKPYAEVAELSLTPDENNEVMFSVADYIRNVNIRNNPTLFSMPLNLDAFTGFYIATAETYDQSDNYSLYTSEPDFEDDDFEGYAIAGKLEFKNVYSGDYADYVYTSGSPAQWLTNRTRLLAVEGYYFDLSFIKNTSGNFALSIKKYLTSDYYITDLADYEDHGIGVYRIPITTDANYEAFCVEVLAAGEGVGLDLSDFQNNPGSGVDWTTGATPSVSNFLISNSDVLYDNYAFVPGVQYTVTAAYTATGSAVMILSLRIYDGSFNIQFNNGNAWTGNQTGAVVITFTATALTTRIGLRVSWASNDSETITITSITVSATSLKLTEEICIDILEACEVEGGFTPDTARRLTEDGGYRLLE